MVQQWQYWDDKSKKWVTWQGTCHARDSGQGGGGPPSKRSWQCSYCHATNNSPKTCSQCGLRRTYAQAARAAAPGPPSPPPAAGPAGSTPPTPPSSTSPTTTSPAALSAGAATRQKLQELTHKLVQHGQELTAPAPEPAPAPPPAQDRKTTADAINGLEASLAAVPESEAETRAMIEGRLSSLRAQLTNAKPKPVGARMDAARDALQRAASRRDDAREAVAAAQALLATCEAEVAKYEDDVKQLEAELAQPVDTDTGEITDPWLNAQTYLTGLVDKLKSDPYVPAEHASSAADHVSRLFTGFAETIKQAQASRRAAAAAARPARMKGKQSSPEQPGRLVRHVGKQSPKRLMTDYFTVTRKVVKVGGQDGPLAQAPSAQAQT